MSSRSERRSPWIRAVRAAALAALLGVAAAEARADDLARAVDDAIAKLGKGAKVSALARIAGTGETLYARDDREARTPASTMKLATTAAALDALGAAFEHETQVLARGTLEGGVLHGDLVVRGSGDPTISRRFDGDPLLGDWAAELAKKVKTIEGDVVADDRAFERLGFHPDWEENDAQDWFAAEVSALDLNDNCVEIETAPEGSSVRARTFPETSYVTLDVRATLAAAKGEHKIAYVRERDDPARPGVVVRVDGKVYQKASPFTSTVAVRRPALFFATVLRERLAKAGVVVKGRARLVEDKEAEAKGPPLFVRRSPIVRSVGICNKRSQNLYAECLLKTVGRAVEGEGSWTAGARAIEKFLDRIGVAREERAIRDGSGLSREGRLSARALVTVIEKATSAPSGQTFRDSLSIAGEDGTLEKRLHDLPSGVRVRAKTGTMHGVSSLAGVVEIESGRGGGRETVSFALIVNGTRGAAGARAAQDELVRAIVRARAAAAKPHVRGA